MLHLHRADRAERLIDQLARVLAEPSPDPDPFVPELISVPSRGIERWLAQELSQRVGVSPERRDGVCANVVFPFPASVIRWVLDGAGGEPVDVYERRSTVDPWAPPRLVWTLLRVVDDVEGLGAFGAHLAGEHGRSRRLAALRHAADLFDRYAIHRPEMVRAWHQGRDVDGVGDALDETARWQPRLWRAARELAGPSFAEQVAALADGGPLGRIAGMPSRLALYGLTALPPTYVDALDALATAHDVHVFLLHPSPGLWDRLRPQVDADLGRPLRTDDPTADRTRHPLVRSWGRDSREMQVVLGGRGTTEVGAEGQLHLDVTDGAPAPRGPLLHALQDAVRRDVAPPGAPVGDARDRRLPLEATAAAGADAPRRATDATVQVHACHGRVRQVEVLRDVVLGLMSDDPTLQPRDIVVMCPDVETFAPLVDAVFGADARLATVDPAAPDDLSDEGLDRLPDVRVRLADRSLRQVNPMLRTVSELLLLPDSRVEAKQVLDLARRQPVRERFGFDTDELGAIEQWVTDACIRWGLHADHRGRHGLATDGNTWRAGLDRLLLGVAVSQEGARLCGGVLPHDDIEGPSVELAGRFAEMIERVDAVCDRLGDPRPITRWCEDLRWATELLTDTAPGDEWQRIQLDRVLDGVREAAGEDDAPDVDVTLSELRELLDDALRGRPSRANHRTGDLTVCTLVPMRSVPYRVVCLLGMDDETFPRRTVPSGDDLIARDPQVGDRDARTEDRQLLLDALLAAREHLVVTYRARDERTNAPVPPAVPIAELLDVIDATASPADGHGRGRDLVVRQHPLRAADPRAFAPEDPFGFDPVARAATAASVGEQTPAPSFRDHLPAADWPTTVEWSDFVRFIDRPVKGYLRDRLHVSLRSRSEARNDDLSVELDNLEDWAVGTRLLTGALAGELDAWCEAERRRGVVPVGHIGSATIDRIRESVEVIAGHAREAYGGDVFATAGTPIEIDLQVGGLHLVGAVEDVRPDALVLIEYGTLKPKRMLKLWLPWLVLQATGHGRRGLAVTRGKTRSEVARLTELPAEYDPAQARGHLEFLAGLYTTGHDDPLPLFPGASPAFAKVLREEPGKRPKAITAASKEWVKDYPGSDPYGDGLDPEVVQVFGRVDLEDVLTIAPAAHERGPGWTEDEPSRFGRLALALWGRIFDDITSRAIREGAA